MRRRITLETLESRVMPAVFGTPWPDATHLTVSFVADSVTVNPSWTDASNVMNQGEHSSLFAMMAASGLTTAQWQGEILRALQTWASVANIDISQVADSGDSLGVAGAIQGDARFGDIRISAMALGSDAMAITTPFSTQAGTFSGDIIFNTRYAFGIGSGPGIGYDLYSAALHEGGHALGLAGSADRSSILYENYQGAFGQLGATDVASIQSLYGARAADAFEKISGNDTLATATGLGGAALSQFTRSVNALGEEATLPDGSPLQVIGDLTTANDVDVYFYQATSRTPFQVHLEASDLGLLATRLTVLDANGNVVGQATSSEPGQDLVLNIAPEARGTFFLKVDSPRSDAFSIGHYRLVLDSGDVVATANRVSVREALLALAPNNDTLANAIGLDPLVAGSAVVGAYAVQGRLASGLDVDYYHLDGSAHSTSLTVFLSGTGEMGLAVLDKDGNVLTQRVVQGSLSLSLDDLPARGGIYLVVTGANSTSYRLSALRNAPAAEIPLTTTGSLTTSTPYALRGLVVPASSLVRMDFQFSSAQPGAVEVVLLDSQGKIVYRQVMPVGETVTLNLFLTPDAYSVCFVGGTSGDGAMSDITIAVSTYLLSDPIGPELIDPNAPPPPPAPDPAWFDLTYYVYIPLLDPYGRPIDIYAPPPVVMVPPTLPPPIPPASPPLMPPILPPP